LDTFSPGKRSDIMRRVRSTDTTPERKVRSLLHKLGFRFRLQRRDLPGKPDIVLPKRRTVIFVHGCFWHRHPGCSRATTPSSSQEYWLPKFRRTIERDKKNQDELRRQGWNVIVVWECEVKHLTDHPAELAELICQGRALLPGPGQSGEELHELLMVAEDGKDWKMREKSEE
jgi:DNA mismatch endonuclease (patch repair protein)